MSQEIMSFPNDARAGTFLLTVRGKTVAGSPEDARSTHNTTAGAPPSVAAARSLGDLSHNVYVGYSADLRDELLFIDYWNSLSGLGRFFSDPQVQAGAQMLFATRDNPVWSPADDFGSFHLAVPSGRTTSGVGVVRTQVTTLSAAADAFRAYADATINRARLYGIVSHTVWARVADPGADAAPEVIGVDMWLDADDMYKYYDMSLGFEHLGPVFAGKPDSSTWRAAPGEWVEW